MSPARRMTEEERQSIAKERSEGVSASDLAQRFGVSLKAVYNAVNQAQGRQGSNGSRPRVVGLRLSEAELRQFDAVLTARGIAHRSDALRCMVHAASGLLAPDGHMREELRSLGAALSRMGNNLNQIARRLNEDRVRGMAPLLADPDRLEIRSLADLVFALADQLQEMSRNRRAFLQLELDTALASLFAKERNGPS